MGGGRLIIVALLGAPCSFTRNHNPRPCLGPNTPHTCACKPECHRELGLGLLSYSQIQDAKLSQIHFCLLIAGLASRVPIEADSPLDSYAGTVDYSSYDVLRGSRQGAKVRSVLG